MSGKYLVVALLFLFAFTGCSVTVKAVETDETKAFVKEMKEKYTGLDSCKFSTRSGHSFNIEYLFSSERDEEIYQAVVEDTMDFIRKNRNVVTGSEIGIHCTFTDQSEVLFNLEDIDKPEKWTYFE